ncbi:carboxymuconolactone decarboxylase family protein [Actinomadura meridiana]|uniref:Carboxymuconolactone decarboxylase family protein n=1 Tax=Actinomadura meridiana TaxID=559626 RepID=A0ABP8CIY7_9ACTN
MTEPRIAPLDVDAYHQLERDLFGPEALTGDWHVSRTWANSPGLTKAQRPLQNYLLGESPLPPRDRELAILRVAWRGHCEYAFGQHVRMGAAAGLTSDEINRVPQGPTADAWTPFQSTVLQAVDELYDTGHLTNETWSALATEYNKAQLLDLIAVVGRYWTVAAMLNTVRVNPEPDLPTFPTRTNKDR